MSRAQKLFLLAMTGAIWILALVVRYAFESQHHHPPPSQLYSVISQQIHAFQAADYRDAYRHVSSGFQDRFSLQAFADLARSDYPELIAADHLEFGATLQKPGEASVEVFAILPNGSVLPCIYRLIHEPDGWHIDSTTIQRPLPSSERIGPTRL